MASIGMRWMLCSVGLVLLAACTGLQRQAPLAGQDAAVTTPSDSATAEQGATDSTAGSAVDSNDEARARLQVPAGFAINTFFGGLRTPRLMAVGPDGNLYIAEQGAGAVVRLPDADNDGVADERQVVAEGLAEPHSVEWFGDSLYVAVSGRVLRMADQNGDGDFMDDGEQVTITDNIPTGGGHSSRTLHFGPDGKLYVAAGSSSNIGVESDRRRATIMRFNADGSIPDDNPFADDEEETRRPVWAEGLRNSVDFLFLPDGRLWADHNGSDGLGDENPPEEIVIEVVKGKHYGWPYCYTPELGAVPPGTQDVHDERIAFDERLADCSQSTPALFTDLAHQAPLGIVQYNQQASQAAFPAEYQGNLFVAYHGSWNSSTPRDCRVQMIVVQDGAPVESQPFVTGFRDSETEDCGNAWGRPAGIAVGALGELFVSDDQNGNIYRVVYTGSQ